MTSIPRAVVDTDGVRHTLAGCLGQGGQGAVFAVEGKPLAVKRLLAATINARRRLDRRLAAVRRLPLEGLNVARPLRTLAAPDCGYVMELMTGMQPISDICHVPRSEADLLHRDFLAPRAEVYAASRKSCLTVALRLADRAPVNCWPLAVSR